MTKSLFCQLRHVRCGGGEVFHEFAYHRLRRLDLIEQADPLADVVADEGFRLAVPATGFVLRATERGLAEIDTGLVWRGAAPGTKAPQAWRVGCVAGVLLGLSR